MKTKIVAGVFAALLATTGASNACSRAAVSGANKIIQANTRISQPVIDAAIRSEINFHRCMAGLSPLKQASSLRKVAETHAKWMARSRKLSHKSRVAGQTTPFARIKASGIQFRAGSENIGQLGRYQFGSRSFRIKNSAACVFSTNAGKPIAPHSYATLAREVVNLWMASRGHRRNILDRKVSRVGSGLSFDARAPYCGRYYVSQSFAG
jgi:uncharacterized protein YkwD